MLFITSDEGATGVRLAVREAGYAGTLPYSHTSTLRTFEEVFCIAPLLREAGTAATNLSDLFTVYP